MAPVAPAGTNGSAAANGAGAGAGAAPAPSPVTTAGVPAGLVAVAATGTPGASVVSVKGAVGSPTATAASSSPDPATPPGAGAGLRGPSEMGERRASEVLPALVRRPWKHLQQAVEQLGDDPPDEALHEIRIRAKRLRYAAEAVAGVIGKPARQLASAAAGVQGVLGDMQDAVVAETWLRRQAVSSPPSQALVAGQLVTLQRQQQAACRQEWVRPWKVASQKPLRRWLSD